MSLALFSPLLHSLQYEDIPPGCKKLNNPTNLKAGMWIRIACMCIQIQEIFCLQILIWIQILRIKIYFES